MMQESLGHKLRLMRAERGLSLREAARRAGVVKETISDIERGKTHPYDVTLAKLAQAYEVPIERLLEEPVPLGDASEAGRREPSLLGNPRIVALLREWGYETDEEFLAAHRDLDPDIDDEGIPRGVERAVERLERTWDGLRTELHKPTNYEKLFPQRSSFSEADELGKAHIQSLRSSYASRLRNEVRRVYARRILALMNHSRTIYEASETEDYLVPARAVRRRTFEEEFEAILSVEAYA